MGQRSFGWLRPFRGRDSKKLGQPPPGYTPFPSCAMGPLARRSFSDSERQHSDASSTIPYHAQSPEPMSPPSTPLSPVSSTSLFAADVPPLPPTPPQKPKGARRSRKMDGPRSYHWVGSSKARPPTGPSDPRVGGGVELANPPPRAGAKATEFGTAPVDYGAPPLGYGRRSGEVGFGQNGRSTASQVVDDDDQSSSTTTSAIQLDNFIPHRPLEPVKAGVNDFRTSAMTAEGGDTTEMSNGRYSKKLEGGNRFVIFRRRAAVPKTTPPVHVEDEYFGARQHDERNRVQEIREGEEVLIRFLRNTLGPKAQNLAVRLMNKTPITSSSGFTYVIHQGTEESDLDIIRRDLTSGRLYSAGVKLLGGGWCNLLLGDRFATGSAPRQRHELTYRRSLCSCIVCRVKAMEMMREQSDVRDGAGSDVDSAGISAEILSTMSSRNRTPTHSAMANFVVRCELPPSDHLKSIGASSSTRELEIGTVVRLNYRASAKLKFTEDVRELFGHFAYTGPITHEEVYRKVTTIGVHYYLYNKGKKERKVYIQGELIRLPVQVGVVKLGTQPMYMPELGATFCLYRKQIMSIYVGEIVLEGNSLGSFIKTGIRYYIGFGEERGVQPVYPNKTLGKARKLGINELLLHHHMVDDLEVRCI